MENLSGSLGFRATLNIDDFTVSARAMENQIRQVASTAVNEGAEMEQQMLTFARNAGGYIASYLGVQGFGALLQQIVSVRGQFQQLETAFETMLGSESRAKALMDQMVETAARTPFDLTGVASGAKQLLAYGESADRVNDTLVRLGNIASGLSIPLNEIVYLYGTTMVQNRLFAQDVRQFTGRGIPLVKELAEMYGVTAEEINAMVSEGKIGFDDVEKVILKLTDSGGQFYNLMLKQSASLTGQIANLQDAWETALNKFGESNQDLFSGAISGATYLVENMEDVLRIIKGVAIAFGTYKAAIVVNTLATKGYTGVALIDNAARQAKIALLKLEAAATGRTTAQTNAMTAATEAHIAALQAQLTAEEQSNLLKQVRISTIASLLTVQQQEYLSNLGLTTSSQGYEAAAMGVLTVEQRLALSKTDLTTKGQLYRAALVQEVAAKRSNEAATLAAMRADVKAAAVKVQSAKQSAIVAMQAAEAARYEVYWAKQTGDAVKIAAAEKRLAAAVENQALARKAALAAQSDFYTKKKALETAATRQSAAASIADTGAKNAQAAATGILSTATNALSTRLKALWAVLRANPWGWLLTIVGLVISAFTMFRKEEEETTAAVDEFNATVQQETSRLNALFAILRTTESGTNTHRKAIEKVNEICNEYNKTLLDENATLDVQKKKYAELTTAINENAAAKIKAKYTAEAQQEKDTAQAEALEGLKAAAGFAIFHDGNPFVASENIREASDELFDLIQVNALEAVDRLRGLTGDAYTETYNEVVKKLKESFKEATGATEREMENFDRFIEEYFDKLIKADNISWESLAKSTEQMQKFADSFNADNVVEQVDYVSMSFSDLETKAKAAQKEIDEINAKEVKVEADNSRLKELADLLATIRGAISTKTENLDTEAGISERIKQLKDERANVEINSARYKELTAEIEKLQARLPKNNTKSTAKLTDSLERKELEAQRKLQEAEISIMEEGYEKRMALLALEHQERLDQIDEEERELEAARRAAGKGGLTSDETEGFDRRREIENQSYESEQTKLFEDEIAYRKKQYELYFRWVENMGEDVANKHFATLLKEGNSYAAWVDSQIAKLESKRAQNPESFTQGDESNLFTLTMQQNEITGAKSAIDSFKESVSAAISQAASLAERIEAIARAKEQLASGNSGIVGDDAKAEASLFLTEEQAKADKEVQDKILNNYRSYEQQKKSIQDEYALLRREAERQGNQEALAQLQRAEAEELSALNGAFLMQSDSWRNLFSDLDSLTAGEIDKLVKEIQEKMSTADMNLNLSDLQTVLGQLDKAKQKVLDVNPFRALGSALSAVFKKQQDGSKKSSKQIKKEWKDVADATEGCFDFVNNAIDSCDVLDDLLGDTGRATLQMLQGITMAGIAMAQAIQTAEKGSVILLAISIALQAIQWIAGLLNKDNKIQENIEAIQRDIDELSNSFDRLQDAFDNTYWVYTDEERAAHDQRVKDIKAEMAALQSQAEMSLRSHNYAAYRELTKRIVDLQDRMQREAMGGDMFTLYEQQKANLREQQKLIRQQIELERKKKDVDTDQILEWEEAIKDIDSQIEDLERDMMETLAGTDVQSAIDEFADALVEAYCQGEDAAKALGETTKSVLKNAVVEALKRQFLAKGINDAVEYLARAMGDSELSDYEKQHFENMVNTAGNTFYKALESIGDWIKDAEEVADPLEGAIASLSEETGGVIAGRLNAFVINQSDQTAIMRQSLAYQAQVAANTANCAAELSEVKATLKRIETKDNSLLSQGIA